MEANDLEGTPPGNDPLETGEVEATDEAQVEAPVDAEEDSPFSSIEVDPALQPLAKGLERQFKAILTRKTQELAEERRALGEAAYKGKILDGLMLRPRMVQLIAQEIGMNTPESDELEAENLSEGGATVPVALKNQLAQVEAEVRRLRAEQERDKLFSKYPEAQTETIRTRMAELLRTGEVSTMTAALRVARDEAAESKTKASVRKAPSTETPVPGRRTVEPAPEGKKFATMRDAAVAALKLHGFDA